MWGVGVPGQKGWQRAVPTAEGQGTPLLPRKMDRGCMPCVGVAAALRARLVRRGVGGDPPGLLCGPGEAAVWRGVATG